jgi:class 3 adenylate cyclase
MAERPTGTVTFLMTDIEASTRRWEEQPEAMRADLARHDATLREAIEGHGGWLFKHTGDGMLAAFPAARPAIQAAIAAQRLLKLPVRMGVCTGEAELRDNNYFGPTLNRAARIMDAAHGGQVLVAAVTAAIAEDAGLVELGEYRLRDLSQPERLYQVRAEGLKDRFPALRTLDTSPGNLPVQATSFLGREHDQAEVAEMLGRVRLLTLTGVGGVGKTRLALQVAAELSPEYPDGAWLVELAAVGDPSATGHAVAGTLGITQQPGMTIEQSVAARLTRRELLLVLDNCEHLIEAVALLAHDIVTHCPNVRVLATSREALMVDGEQIWPVPSLGFREGASSPAVALFMERARAVAPRFELGGDAGVISEICRRLDGIPLAIELAAARMRAMSPLQIRDRLDERFRILTGGSRRALERHQTLRHAVQ